MDWKLLASSFAAIFLAEMGDKTQLATLTLAAGESSRWTVFLGSALALTASAALAVVAGDTIARWIPPIWLKRGAGAVFIVLGVLYLSAKVDPGPETQPSRAETDDRPAQQ